MHAPAERKRIDAPSPQLALSEHIYAQRYCLETTRHIAGFIDFVIDANGHSQYIARILQSTKPFISLADAEAWLQARNGAAIVKG